MAASFIDQTNNVQRMLQALEASTQTHQSPTDILLEGIAIFFSLLSLSINIALLNKDVQKISPTFEIDTDDSFNEKILKTQAILKKLYQTTCQRHDQATHFFYKTVLSMNSLFIKHLYKKFESIRHTVLEHDADATLLAADAHSFTDSNALSDYLNSL